MSSLNLVFFRHGIAEPDVVPDQDRPLTEEGTRKTRGAAEGLKTMDIAFDKILTSPWLRAKQTAAILGEVLGKAPEELPELAGTSSVDELLTALAQQRKSRALILVGHQPLL